MPSPNAAPRHWGQVDLGRDFGCARCGFTGVAHASFEYTSRGHEERSPSDPLNWRVGSEADHLVSLAACPKCGRRSTRAVGGMVVKLLLLGLGLSGLLGWLFLPLLAPLRVPTPAMVACGVLITSLMIALPLYASLRKAKRCVSF